ncbi:MAG: 3',5'-cyclic-nucleotide phosphodiesterase [Myxococcales bacterium]
MSNLGLLVVPLLLLTAAPEPRPAAFELKAVGVLGGDADSNLSCYLLGRANEPAALMLDGGSVFPGLVKLQERAGRLAPQAGPSAQVQAALALLDPLQALLLSHAHLDHVGGFLQQSTLQVTLALRGHAPLEVVSLPETAKTLTQAVFHSALWSDFTQIPKGHPALKLSPLEPLAKRTVGPFSVQAVAVNHPVESAAFLISSGEDAFLYVGDTGATTTVWKTAGPVLAGGRLRAIVVEVSFPVADEKLAEVTGHLTRNSLLLELAKLSPVPIKAPLPTAATMTEEDAVALARQLAPAFRTCPIVATHIKAMKYDQVVKELKAAADAGLNVVVPVQGETYRF